MLLSYMRAAFFYSVLIASSADKFMARLAGKYPDIIPMRAENAMAAKANHIGIIDILVVPYIPIDGPNFSLNLFIRKDIK